MARKRRNKFKTYRSDIVDLSHEGKGVARIEGKTVFVHGALPAEDVTFTTYRSKRTYEFALADEIHTASDDRVEPRCEAYQVCGGCALQHLDVAAQRSYKREHLLYELSNVGGVTAETCLPDLYADDWNYRRRGRLGVKHVPGKGRVLVGFRERRAPYIADMHRCEILAKPVDSLIMPLSELIGQLSIHGRLPQVELAVADNVTALVFRILDPVTDQDRELLLEFGKNYQLDVYLQPGGNDTVTPLSDVSELYYELPEYDVKLYFRPLDFVQINAALNQKMISHVLEHAGLLPGDRVLDLFCGLGNFSLPLARCADYVVGIEGEESLVKRARWNCQRNHIENAEFHVANLFKPESQWQWLQQAYDVVLIDPPRAGAQEIIPLIKKLKPRVIAYVSCHPSTLARDAAQIVKDSAYNLTKTGIMDMFPHTGHVESVAFFERS